MANIGIIFDNLTKHIILEYLPDVERFMIVMMIIKILHNMK